MTTRSSDGTPSPYVVLFLLFTVYTFNYLDRQIIGILAAPIKADMKLSDTQLGLMGGFAFAIFYSTLGVPIARIADKKPRNWLIAIAFFLWSGFTALCGMAANFWQLLFARLGVGVGEAGGVAPSYSMICDYFPPQQRTRAIAAFTMAVPVGSAAGLLIGGELAARYGWRTAFLVLGVSGLILAPVFLLLVRDPGRGRFDAGRPDAQAASASLFDVLKLIASKPSFWFVSLGTAFAGMMLYGLGFWLPSYFQRSLNFSLSQTAQFLFVVTLIGGVAGTALGGWLGDRGGSKKPSKYATLSGAVLLISCPFLLAALMLDSVIVVFFLLLIPQALGLTAMPPSIAAIQLLAPASMRATASAVFLLITNFIGLGVGTVIFGALSDFFVQGHGAHALRYALMLCAITLYPLAALMYFLAARDLSKDIGVAH